MTSRRLIFALLGLTIACVFAIPPASVANNSQKSQPQMVFLHVRVTDPNGKAVADVAQSSFQVTEDGVPQKIEFFYDQAVPLSYGLLIDNSGTMRDYLQKVIDASIRIVNSNTDADETFIVRFISSDKIETVQEPTSNKRLLIEGLNSLYIDAGQTAVIDAVYLSAETLAKAKSDVTRPRRKVLILVTDGEERNSYYKEKHLLQLLNSTDSQVYIIGLTQLVKPDNYDKATRLLNLLARETGGRLYMPATLGDLNRTGDEIINDIRTQYVIGYVPTSPVNEFHKVQVTIAENPNQEKRVAVTRVGYRTQEK